VVEIDRRDGRGVEDERLGLREDRGARDRIDRDVARSQSAS